METMTLGEIYASSQTFLDYHGDVHLLQIREIDSISLNVGIRS